MAQATQGQQVAGACQPASPAPGRAGAIEDERITTMHAPEAAGAAAKLVYVGMTGPEDPTRACMPFALAVATVDDGMEAIVHLRGDGVILLRDRVACSVQPIDLPPLCEVFGQVREHAIPVYV
jgi:hypothetical protein